MACQESTRVCNLKRLLGHPGMHGLPTAAINLGLRDVGSRHETVGRDGTNVDEIEIEEIESRDAPKE